MIAGLRRLIGALVVLAVLAAAALAGWALLRGERDDMPWKPLDLGQPIGAFTGRKLSGLSDDFPRCQALLDRAGVRYDVLAPVTTPNCSYADGVRLTDGGSFGPRFQPRGVGVSCPVAAALVMWNWNVVQPAARRYFGASVSAIDHFGSYSCRRLYGRATGDWSEHAHANAIDIAGFRLSDGTRVSVASDWEGEGATGERGDKAAFLRAVRDGACDVFATVLSPDYNAAHHDHLHLDQADRGRLGWRACR